MSTERLDGLRVTDVGGDRLELGPGEGRSDGQPFLKVDLATAVRGDYLALTEDDVRAVRDYLDSWLDQQIHPRLHGDLAARVAAMANDAPARRPDCENPRPRRFWPEGIVGSAHKLASHRGLLLRLPGGQVCRLDTAERWPQWGGKYVADIVHPEHVNWRMVAEYMASRYVPPAGPDA